MKYLQEFKTYLKVEKGLSDNTIQNYERDLLLFIPSLDKDVEEVSIHDIRQFLATQSDLGKARSSISRYICSIKEYYKFIEMYYNVPSPAKELKSYQRNESLPKNLSLSDMGKILAVTNKSSIKTRLIVELLYGTGCRVSELVNIKVEDIDFEEGFINILGKGSKERLAPLHDNVAKTLREYMNKYSITQGYIFLKRGSATEPMSRISVTNLMKDIGKRAEVTSNVSAHVMRHSFATHMIENGCDMSTMQELLGHSDIKTTKIYARVTKDVRKKALANFHPLSQ